MMNKIADAAELRPLSAQYDPWDPITSLRRYGKHTLTSVEFTISNLCNMRCEHCAVGNTLTLSEGDKLPLADALRRLDELERLETISITGGEPTYSAATVNDYIVPLLQYARSRGVRSQLNSNLTLDYSRYAPLVGLLDVMHISYNYLGADDFHDIAYGKAQRAVSRDMSARLYERMVANTVRLSGEGMFVSAESMINYRTDGKLPDIHRHIVEMGCLRHEVHPMYPSAFAADLPMLPLARMREAIADLLARRDPAVWMLFGTLPFFHCSSDPADRELLRRLSEAGNVTVRNDPDGRNRLNVNMFTGDIFVTDFADVPALGNMRGDRLDDIFERWLEHQLYRQVNCHCPTASCCGPNLLVKDMYYKEIDFMKRQAII